MTAQILDFAAARDRLAGRTQARRSQREREVVEALFHRGRAAIKDEIESWTQALRQHLAEAKTARTRLARGVFSMGKRKGQPLDAEAREQLECRADESVRYAKHAEAELERLRRVLQMYRQGEQP